MKGKNDRYKGRIQPTKVSKDQTKKNSKKKLNSHDKIGIKHRDY